MAEAVNYTLGQWTELNVFCADDAAPIDNNISERKMKRVVLNRKNSLFAGNPRGGHTAAILATLASICRRHEIDPQLYLAQLLVNLPSWPARDLDAWLPGQWKLRQAARPATLQETAIADSQDVRFTYRLLHFGCERSALVYPSFSGSQSCRRQYAASTATKSSLQHDCRTYFVDLFSKDAGLRHDIGERLIEDVLLND